MHNWDTEIEQIKEWYGSGKTLKGIGDYYGVTGERIRQILVKYNVPARRTVKEYCIIHHDRMLIMYKDYLNGMTVIDIGRKYGLAPGTIYGNFNRHKLRVRPPGPLPKQNGA